jgi:hypothetical protein
MPIAWSMTAREVGRSLTCECYRVIQDEYDQLLDTE